MKTVLFVVSEDWYFVSHRLPLAEYAVAQGYQVGVLCNVSDRRSVIEQAGIDVFDWQLLRKSKNPLNELRSIAILRRCVRSYEPDIIHAVALKPILYTHLTTTSSAVRLVSALGGLGYTFSSDSRMAKALRGVIRIALQRVIRRKNSHIIMQNPDDMHMLTHVGIQREDGHFSLIPGVGVDHERFHPKASPAQSSRTVIYTGRLLWDKGMDEFVQVARAIKSSHPTVRFVLAGMRDEHNPECVPSQVLEQWCREGVVEWAGYQKDVVKSLHKASVFLFPSYREGFPKAVLEASSCGLPVVTFDVPGCREVVNHGTTGYLIPFKDVAKMQAAVRKLLDDHEHALALGQAGRERVLQQYTVKHIADQTLRVWEARDE
ncbi:MAG TPA: glycosyltransferase family 1 protein [Gammaproteobacteria bacterium]|nr:glycosyltransferase family 1 protein [Gammaproteobacteria bacterium]